jgi:drug/metabolite transporter (DMT)-like permease
MLLGLVMYALTQGAQFVAIDNQPAATTSLVLSLTPLVVAAASTVATGEPPSIRQTTGAGLVAGGAILYFVGDLGATTVGMAAALTGLASNAWASLLGRRVNRASDLPSAVVTTIGMTLGGALLLAAGAVSGGSLPVSGRSWALIGWLAVVNTALAFTMWNRSLRRLTALESAGINNTMLIQIAALGWIFLDEAPGPAALAGVIVVSAGVLMTQAAGAPRSRRA